jgi:hypothetical protein
MKKFILKVLLFIACVVVMDFAFGLFFSYLRAHAKGGSTANCEYIANKATDDIIILGSSRATHHYVPQIIEDSLGVSCYNCGEEGNGVILAYGRLKMLANRYKPKLVLYELTPGYDYGFEDPNSKYLGYLRPYYKKEGIKQIFEDFDDNLSCLKMRSKMYQNTSRLLPNIVDIIFTRNNNKGFEPLEGKMKFIPEMTRRNGLTNIDKSKLSYLEKIIDLCVGENIPLVFIISPILNYNSNQLEYEPALRLSEENDIRVINNLKAEDIYLNPELFQDVNHLNEDGAKIYSQFIVSQIKNYYSFNVPMAL